ncbi:MAG: L-lactate dehydrogenase [Myxococcota bacterium]
MRIGIIGMGWVGSSVAISTLHQGVATDLLLHDLKPGLAEGEAMDLAHGASFYPGANVRAVDEVEEMADCDAVVVAAGQSTRHKSRLELLTHTAAIGRSLGEQLSTARGLVVVVTNPVDVVVRVVREASGLPPERVLGTGTMLDTARLRRMLGEALQLDARSVHANVVGEHGDSSVALFGEAFVGGIPLRTWPGYDPSGEAALLTRVRRAAYEIIDRKGATNHAIGLVTAHLLRWMLRGERRVLTVSRVQRGAFGLDGVALSLPTVVGRGGAVRVVEPPMDEEERAGLAASVKVLEDAYASIR